MQIRKTKYYKKSGRRNDGILKNHKIMAIFVSVVAFMFVVFSSSVVITGVARSRAEAAEEQAAQLAAAEARLKEQRLLREKEERRNNAFFDVQLRASGAIVIDVNSGSSIFEKNADMVFPLASITKVMTVVTADEYLASDDQIYIDQEAINTEGDSGLLFGELWSFSELADLTMIVSSNDGAVAIAKAAGAEINRRDGTTGLKGDVEAFVQKMNEKAKEIGLKNATFQNPSGLDLDLETRPSATASSRDVAVLMEHALTEKLGLMRNSTLANHIVRSMSGREVRAVNTNQAAGTMPGLLISKTGNTLQAGGTLAVAVDVGVMQPVVIVALGSTIAERVGDVNELYEAAKIYFENL